MAIKYPRPRPQVNGMGYATHDFAAGTTAWTLSAEEAKCRYLAVSNAGGAANIYAPPTGGLSFILRNASGQAITLLVYGQTGITVANAKTAEVYSNGTDYLRATADQTH